MERLSFAPRGRAALPVIESAKLRVAHLDSRAAFDGARAFPPERWSGLEAFSPNVLAGSVAHLQRLMERIGLKTVSVGGLDHSVFVVTQLGDTPLSNRFRDRLWRQFAVPVYEVYVDERARPLAFECEAQEGWHVVEGVRFCAAYGELVLERGNQVARTGLDWTIEETGCDCGRRGVRLVMPRRRSGRQRELVAISA